MKRLPSSLPLTEWARQLLARRSRPSGHAPSPAAAHTAQGSPIVPGAQSVLQHPLLVFDLETSGLDLRHDTVLSIGAVRVEDNAIPLAGHIDQVLRVETPLKRDSQLLHGLSQDDLAHGRPAADVLQALLDYGDGCIWLAFHAGFDQHMLDRALHRHLRCRFRQTLFDVATLAPMLYPAHHVRGAGLDHWSRVLGLDTPARHNAAGDALLTAELVLILMNQAHRQGMQTWKTLADAMRRWRTQQDGAQGPMF